MPELQDPFIGRVSEGDRKAESGELSNGAAYARIVQQKATENVRTWREELRATLAEEPKTQGAEYYAALERFLQSRPNDVDIESVSSEERGIANERAWREELTATLAEEPKTQGAEYYAALERFLNGDTSEEQLS